MSVRNKILNSGNPDKIRKILDGMGYRSWDYPKARDLLRANKGSVRIRLRDALTEFLK